MRTPDRPIQKSSAAQRIERMIDLLDREGARALARRKLAQLCTLVAERSRIWRGRRRAWRSDKRPVFLMISHRCGGGTERHLGDLEKSLRAEGVRPVEVRPGRRGKLVWEERGDRPGTVWCRESGADGESIAKSLGELKPVHAHVHHSLGLPDILFDLLVAHGVSYDWTIHDYYAICPRVNLIGSGGRYCGEPDNAGCDSCLTRLGDDQGRPVAHSISAWRKQSADRLAGARRVFAPNADVMRRLERYVPCRNVTLRPHTESLPQNDSLAASLRADEPVRVAVIGTLTQVKGSERLLACARNAALRRLPLQFCLIGSSDRDALLAREGNVHVMGRYRESEVYDRLKSSLCHLAFLPSECPESHMYTMSIAMAARFFVVCFNVGAQALRVQAWGWGKAIPFDLDPATINDLLISAAKSLAGRNPPLAPPAARYPDLLASYYDFTAAERDRILGRVSGHVHTSGPSPHLMCGRNHAHLH
jgi:glycosyltransferase involved in cell wall biosynthesis